MTALWHDLYPDRAWPGPEAAAQAMAEELRALRLVAQKMATAALDGPLRDRDSIQMAHDILIQLMLDKALFDDIAIERDQEKAKCYVDAFCWVLQHSHNQTFGEGFADLEAELALRGIEIERHAEMQYPGAKQ